MNKFNVFAVFLVALAFCGCERIGLCKDDELSFGRVDYTGNQLRVNGYYFGDVIKDDKMPLANIYYLYKNGVFLSRLVQDLDKAQLGTISIDTSNSFAKRVKSAWGVFRVNGKIIEFERWEPSMNSCEKTVYERGEVVSDTSFVLKRREFRTNGKVGHTENLDSIFSFRSTLQKPDSTNQFIK